ncbi:hypothetical protein L1887_54390 [Cichorium endivia]|nr:hypothetical protein L1887_54390 [Cichorium endivia]
MRGTRTILPRPGASVLPSQAELSSQAASGSVDVDAQPGPAAGQDCYPSSATAYHPIDDAPLQSIARISLGRRRGRSDTNCSFETARLTSPNHRVDSITLTPATSSACALGEQHLQQSTTHLAPNTSRRDPLSHSVTTPRITAAQHHGSDLQSCAIAARCASLRSRPHHSLSSVPWQLGGILRQRDPTPLPKPQLPSRRSSAPSRLQHPQSAHSSHSSSSPSPSSSSSELRIELSTSSAQASLPVAFESRYTLATSSSSLSRALRIQPILTLAPRCIASIRTAPSHTSTLAQIGPGAATAIPAQYHGCAIAFLGRILGSSSSSLESTRFVLPASFVGPYTPLTEAQRLIRSPTHVLSMSFNSQRRRRTCLESPAAIRITNRQALSPVSTVVLSAAGAPPRKEARTKHAALQITCRYGTPQQTTVSSGSCTAARFPASFPAAAFPLEQRF